MKRIFNQKAALKVQWLRVSITLTPPLLLPHILEELVSSR
jgi:hypothetical protein